MSEKLSEKCGILSKIYATMGVFGIWLGRLLALIVSVLDYIRNKINVHPITGGDKMEKKESSTKTTKTTKKQDSKKMWMMIGGIVAAVVVIAIIIFVIVKMVSGGKKTLSCTQKSAAVDSSVVYEFENDKVSKAELKYVWDKTVKESDEMATGLALLVTSKDALEKAYESEPGINFSVDDSDSKATISFDVDLKNISSEVREAVLDDDGSTSFDEVKKQVEANGFTCTVE